MPTIHIHLPKIRARVRDCGCDKANDASPEEQALIKKITRASNNGDFYTVGQLRKELAQLQAKKKAGDKGRDAGQIPLRKGGGSYLGAHIEYWNQNVLPKATESELQAVIANDPNGSKANMARKELARRGSGDTVADCLDRMKDGFFVATSKKQAEKFAAELKSEGKTAQVEPRSGGVFYVSW
jgi:hypothetical protein